MAQGPRIALPQLQEWRAGIADCYFADWCFADCYCCCADCYFDDALPNPKKKIAPRRRCVCGPRPRLLCVQVARALKKKVCRWHPRPKNCSHTKKKMCAWPKAQELLCHSLKNGGRALLIAILLIAVLLIAIVVLIVILMMIPSRIPRRRSHPEEDVCVVRGPGCCVYYMWPMHSRRRCAGGTQGQRIAFVPRGRCAHGPRPKNCSATARRMEDRNC